MAINFKKFFLRVLEALAAVFMKRGKIKVVVCAVSGLLPGPDCKTTEEREYYKDPKPTDTYRRPTETCAVCQAEEPPDPPEPEKVKKIVCQVSGRLPGPYCKTVEREFLPENVPVNQCVSCKAPIPYADHSAPRTGMDFYQAVVFELALVKTYLDALVEAGGSLARFFGDFTWPEGLATAGWLWSLFKRIGTYVDEGGPYNGRSFPFFTIAESTEYGSPWNEVTWAKYQTIFKLCAERGIRVTWSILDGCSMKTPWACRHQPLLQNLQHLGAEANVKNEYTRLDGTKGRGLGIHTGGIYGGFGSEAGGSMKEYLRPLIKKAVATLRAVPDLDWRIMPGNEMARAVGKDETQAQADKVLHDWHEFWIQELLELEVKPAQIVLSITGTNTQSAVTAPLLKKYPGVIEQIHGPNSDVSLLKAIERNPGAEIDGDGNDSQAAGFSNGYMTLPSIEQCRKIREIIKARGMTYQTFNAHCEGKIWQDITKAGWEEQRALAGK